jgi:hypothetical protein
MELRHPAQEILDLPLIYRYISAFYKIRRLLVVRPAVSLHQNPGCNPEKMSNFQGW